MPKITKATPVKKTPAKTKKSSPPKKVDAPVPVALPLPVDAPVPVAPPLPVKTQAELIWDEIRALPLQMFGLPNQTVEQYVTPFPVEPSKLYVTIRVSAVLPALETVLNPIFDHLGRPIPPKFLVEMVDRFVVISRNPVALFLSKK